MWRAPRLGDVEDSGGGFVTRMEYQNLEQRLVMTETRLLAAETQLRKNDQQMSEMMLQFAHIIPIVQSAQQNAQLRGEQASSRQQEGTGRDRSRTPAPARNSAGQLCAPMLDPNPDFTSVPTLEEFARENLLDDKCLEVLRTVAPEVQHYVLKSGPVDGRNPSAMVMGRIQKCTTEFGTAPVSSDMPRAALDSHVVDEFGKLHGLDEKCMGALRLQTPECQEAVITMGPVEGRNPNAMVMGRIAKFCQQRKGSSVSRHHAADSAGHNQQFYGYM